MGVFSKRPGRGVGLGRGVSDGMGDEFETIDEQGVPASEAVIEGEALTPFAEDPAFRADVDEAMRVSTPRRSLRDRFSRVRLGRGGKAPTDEIGADVGEDAADRSPSTGGRGRFSFARRTTKAEKAKRVAEASAATDLRLSNMVMIDFYPGLTKEDAVDTARHWAMTHMDIPSLCYYYIHKIRDGFAIEVQEGVGKAYLPSVIQMATDNPGRIIVVPMVRRKLTVLYSSRLGEFEAQILPELQEPPAMPENPPIPATRSSAMTPVLKQHVEWLYAGAGTALVGGLALLASLTFYAFDPKAKVPPEWHTTEVSQLPVMQWNRLNADATDSYVVRLEFTDGQWRVVRQAVNGATVDVGPAAPAAPDAQIQGSGDVGAAPQDQGGVPGVSPGGVPQGAPTNIPPPSDNGGR